MASANLQPIVEQVTRLTTVTASVLAAFAAQNEKIQAAGTLEEAQAIAQQFADQSQVLADAAVANTPSDTPEAKARRAKS